ncbi:hypothetical protein JOB18_001839 [Solea senegalensis]|uniref:Uncharacterized protein n=1 Tax=Solea senegalensis TaxID=28829 RepID=A0AAV6Q0X5_SOLSE|nr:hypothetical protein JOB18_001839 [Solea senegalensis]
MLKAERGVTGAALRCLSVCRPVVYIRLRSRAEWLCIFFNVSGTEKRWKRRGVRGWRNEDCSFQSNIYGTFKSHKSRKHTPHTYVDFKPGIVKTTRLATQTDVQSSDREEEDDGEEVCAGSPSTDVNTQPRELSSLIEQQLGAALLKLEYLVHVPGTAIDEFLEELHHLLSSPTSTVSKSLVGDILQSNNIQVDKSIIADIATAVCSATPVHKALEKGGPLSTSYLRRRYYNEKFGVVEPVTYVLNVKEKHTFQLFLIVNVLCAWYNEHYRAFALEQTSKTIKLIALDELMDTYPLSDYRVGRSRMIKRSTMSALTVLRVILDAENSQRLLLEGGFPKSVDEVVQEVKRQCNLNYTFRLQFMDEHFGNAFTNLTRVEELKDKGTIKVIRIESSQCAEASLSHSVLQPPLSPSSVSVSSGSVDTDILSSSDSSSSRTLWPVNFPVPQFSYDSELKLERGNATYKKNGTPLIPDLKLKSNILETLVQEIIKYKVYCSGQEFNAVAKALVSKHPCLNEKGSHTGHAGWKASLANKLAMYRTQLRKLGCTEVTVNSLKNKPEGKASPAAAIKKPRRSEVNYCPPHPIGESDTSLERLRVELLADVTRTNREVIKMKMEKTFSYRRREVISKEPMVNDFKARWPAFFHLSEINAEYKRITTMLLQSRFLSQLDIHTDQLIKLFGKRGGLIGTKLKHILEEIGKSEDTEVVRELIIKGLCVYLHEDPAHLFMEYENEDPAAIQDGIEDTTVGIFLIRQNGGSEVEDILVVLEGQAVLVDLPSVGTPIRVNITVNTIDAKTAHVI